MMRWTIAGTLVALAVGLSNTSVWAHAEYDHSVPAQNEVVAQPPDHIDVFFGQEVFKQTGANFVRVFDDAGTQVSDGDGVVDDDDRTHISAAFPSTLAPGRYIVRWMTLSDEDGESDDGAFCFYVAVEPTEAQQAECAALAEEEEPAPTTAGGTPTVTEITPQPAATAADAGDGDGDGGGSNGAIVGSVIGGVAAVAVVGVGFVLWRRRSKV